MKKLLALIMALAMVLALAACGSSNSGSAAPAASADKSAGAASASGSAASGDDAIPGTEDGVLTVGMECAYAPYNWTQSDDSNGAVEIVNNPGSYANGYDVMIAKKICEQYGWKLEVMAIEWDGLISALQAGTIDAVIAGQSMTEERLQQVDMAGPYFYASIVCVTKKDAPQASATGISELTGTCTAQTGTIWYDSCLPQIPGADIQTQAETAPAMIMAVESGTVDFICTDLPTATAAAAKNDRLVILNFEGTDGDFQFASEEERAENVNIGMSVEKGNTQLRDAINTVVSALTPDQFNILMEQAIAVQPEI